MPEADLRPAPPYSPHARAVLRLVKGETNWAFDLKSPPYQVNELALTVRGFRGGLTWD
jgi:hypothetical protein